MIITGTIKEDGTKVAAIVLDFNDFVMAGADDDMWVDDIEDPTSAPTCMKKSDIEWIGFL